MPRIFLLTDEVGGKLKLPKQFEPIYVVSGDDSTSMSLGNFLSPEGFGGTFVKDDIFVSLLPQHTSPLEFRIDEFLIPRENFCVTLRSVKEMYQLFNSSDDLDQTEDTTGSDFLLDSEEFELAKQDDYDFFSGNELSSDSPNVKKDIFKRMAELKELTHVFIDAGFLDDGEDVPDHLPRKIDDWMVTFEDPLQKLFAVHTLPETSAPIQDGGDMTIEDEFLVNPSFRKGITIYWMKVLANFMVNNEITSIEEVGSMGSWEDPEVWEELKEFEIEN